MTDYHGRRRPGPRTRFRSRLAVSSSDVNGLLDHVGRMDAPEAKAARRAARLRRSAGLTGA